MLPFSRNQFLALFGDYNLVVWPVLPVAYVLALLALTAGMASYLLGISQDWVLLVSGPTAALIAWTQMAPKPTLVRNAR